MGLSHAPDSSPLPLAAASIGWSALIDRLRAIVGDEHVTEIGPGEEIRGVRPPVVVEPADEREVAQVLELANDVGAAVIPRGGGTKAAWGNPPSAADLVLSTQRLDRIVDHAWADMTVTVDAGVNVAELQRALALHGQRLALDALWPESATIGGILSTNDSGYLRLRFGGLRDLVIGITLALADGTLANSGGRVVKNVAGYDLPKLATGALGTLGVITRATFRLHPLPKSTRTLTISPTSIPHAQALLLAIQDSRLAHTALQMRAAEGSVVLDVLFEGTEAGIAAQERTILDLARSAATEVAAPPVWAARQDLMAMPSGYPAKISVLPTAIGPTLARLAASAHDASVEWHAVVQATGLGWMWLGGDAGAARNVLSDVRIESERSGGSLFIAADPAGDLGLDAWGTETDTLPLMRAIKSQLDPGGILNPGRFLGGI
jgi:glycolate oxidase FAD binding subunit